MIVQNRFNLMPTVVKNLLIINGLFFLGMQSLPQVLPDVDLYSYLALYFPLGERFQPTQLITHMFMHANFPHLAGNMFMLWMFGSAMENYWGPKRFLIYYILTGLGASFLHTSVNILEYYNTTNPFIQALIENGSMVGASGAVFGVLLAYGLTFPNRLLFFIFFPIPIKAKYFVIGYGVLELFNGFVANNSGIAHFAHLGGMLFGYLLIRKWKRDMYR